MPARNRRLRQVFVLFRQERRHAGPEVRVAARARNCRAFQHSLQEAGEPLAASGRPLFALVQRLNRRAHMPRHIRQYEPVNIVGSHSFR